MTSIFGATYVDPTYLGNSAATFGIADAVAVLNAQQLEDIVALSSRAIDTFVGRDFSPAPRTEQHVFDFSTRSIRVNAPPIAAITAFGIRVSVNNIATFQPNQVYVDNQRNVVTLTQYASVGTMELVAPLLLLGMQEPIAEITYTSYQSIPADVAAACAIEAATRINLAYANTLMPQGIGVVKSADVEARREAGAYDATRPLYSDVAAHMLSGYLRIFVA